MNRLVLIALICVLALFGCAPYKTRPPAIDPNLSAQERAKQEALADQEEIRIGARMGLVETRLKMGNRELSPYGSVPKKDGSLFAFADGKAVYVSYGMVRFCQTNDELALVMGHEMAHNAMGHIGAKRANATGGMVIDVILSVVGVPTQGAFAKMTSEAYSPAFEMEADYVGLYYAARAGFNIEHSADFWRRMAVYDPRAMNGGLTHPSSAERFVAIESAVAEIQFKIVSGQPVVPNVDEARAAINRAVNAESSAQ